ncbi:MAG: haloacid dehalogenase-like hydrolase [Actinobacteria bacterium]|nr:haloacid dehalogenase-like hydrolase [Actinomycetota bacterium]
MPPPLYTQPTIAFIWDFDRTLIPSNQQDPLFEAYGVDPDEFWREVEGLTGFYAARGIKIGRDSAYLLHILTYVRAGIFEGLTNARLRELGAGIEPAPGIPEFFEATRRHVAEVPEYAAAGITVEHYTVSTGILPMIEGSCLAPHLDGIWANTFIEEQAPPGYLGHLDMPVSEEPISHIGYGIDNTTKTRAIFEVNKGVNRNPSIDVNALMGQDERRVPMRHMIYIADGPSDVPAFSILNTKGGKTLGVYTTEPRNNFRQVKQLQEQGRIQGMAEADYRPGKAAYLWLMDSLDQIAHEIVDVKAAAVARVANPPGHV